MDIFWLSKSLDNPDFNVKERISSLNNLIDTTINSVRKISSELRPGILDDLGLISAIEWYVEEFEQRTEINCDLNLMNITDNLLDDLSITIYRNVQSFI